MADATSDDPSLLQGDLSLLQGQVRVLEMVALGTPLDETLDALTALIEAQEPGLRCGVLVVAEDGVRFRRGHGASLPEMYHAALEGVSILPPYRGACGQAAHSGETVIVSDVASDFRYPASWRDLLAACGVAAARSIPLRAADGRLLGSMGMFRDRPYDPLPANPLLAEVAGRLGSLALQRARDQAALLAERAQLQAVVETVPAAVWFTRDPDARNVVGNAEAARLMRMPQTANPSLTAAPEQRPTHFRAMRDGAEIPPEQLPMQRAARGETVHAEELQVAFEDGSSLDLLVRATPLRDPSGALAGAICAALDITERRRAEAALRRSEEEFRALGENLPNLCWMARADGWIYWYNRRWYDYTGATEADMAGWGWQSVHDSAALPEVMRRWTDCIAAGQRFEMTFPLRGADGVFRPFLTRVVPVRDAAGAIARWFGNNVDISEQQRTEAALRAGEDALRRLNERLEGRVAEAVAAREQAQQRLAHAQRMEALGQLAGGVAHDFNNVLQAVSGALRLIGRRADDAGAVRDLARMAAESADRGSSITARLLAFARKSELQAAPVAPLPLLEGLRQILAPTLGPGIRVRIDTDSDAPPLLADKAQLETVLVNLAVNARDAMPQGGTLAISAHPGTVGDTAADLAELAAELAPGAYLRLDLTDTGTGMDAATLARASEPFFTTKPDGQGTGLGLAMARGFAQQSGGGLAIRSAPGQGTTVSMWFPQASQPAATAPGLMPPLPTAARRDAAVLLVDADAVMRAVLRRQLQDARGYEAHE